MKKQNNSLFILFFSFLIVFSAFSVFACTGIFKGEITNNSGRRILPPKFPDGGGPLHLTTNLDNNYYFDNNSVYLYVDLKSDKVGDTRERTPLNVAIVIDRSGSMSEKNKLDYVKRAVDYIIDELKPDDYVSIVDYDDYVDVLQRSSTISDKYELRNKVSKLQPGGFTNLSEGMFEGYDQVNRTYARGYVNRVFLLSDGLANRGITDRFKLADMVRDKNRRDGITISTFGVGNDFNENLMTDIADYGKGSYYYINNSSDIPEIFASELNSVKNLVGHSAKIKVRFPSEYLSLNKVFGYPYEISGDEVEIDFKDVFSEQTKSVLLKFDVKRRIDSRLHFESQLTYEDVSASFKQVTVNDSRELAPVKSKDEYVKGNNELVQQNISMFESNDMMENALREADNGNYDVAKTKLKDAQNYMQNQMNTVSASPEMRQQSESMDKYEKDLNTVESKTDEEKKEMQKSGKYDNYNTRKKK
jgi:Ca-activated chloride channel family protein